MSDVIQPTAVIFDIDSTICVTDHRREHIAELIDGKWVNKKKGDWKAWKENAYKDTPNRAVVTIYKAAFVDDSIDVVICLTGRMNDEREQTVKWFVDNNIPLPHLLYMRPVGDTRADTVVKAEIYLSQIKPKYDVIYAVDDRKSVTAVLRELGLTVFQCEEGDY